MSNKPVKYKGEIFIEQCPDNLDEAFELWWEHQGKDYLVGTNISDAGLAKAKEWFWDCFFAGMGWACAVPPIVSAAEWNIERTKRAKMREEPEPTDTVTE